MLVAWLVDARFLPIQELGVSFIRKSCHLDKYGPWLSHRVVHSNELQLDVYMFFLQEVSDVLLKPLLDAFHSLVTSTTNDQQANIALLYFSRNLFGVVELVASVVP